MNASEITANLHADVDDQGWSQDERFYNENFSTLAFMDKHRLYKFFYSLGYGQNFVELCKLYQTMLHDVDDDGDMSLVIATLEHEYVLSYGRSFWQRFSDNFTEFGRTIFDRKFTTTEYTVVRGWHIELTTKQLKPILFYHSDRDIQKHGKVTECLACRFNWEVLKFIAELPTVNDEIVKDWSWKEHCDFDDKIEKMIRDFIVSRGAGYTKIV